MTFCHSFDSGAFAELRKPFETCRHSVKAPEPLVSLAHLMLTALATTNQNYGAMCLLCLYEIVKAQLREKLHAVRVSLSLSFLLCDIVKRTYSLENSCRKQCVVHNSNDLLTWAFPLTPLALSSRRKGAVTNRQSVNVTIQHSAFALPRKRQSERSK